MELVPSTKETKKRSSFKPDDGRFGVNLNDYFLYVSIEPSTDSMHFSDFFFQFKFVHIGDTNTYTSSYIHRDTSKFDFILSEV